MVSVPAQIVMDADEAADDPYLDFDIVAKNLGCDYFDNSQAELDCMRQVSWVQIEEFINRYNSTPEIAFTLYIPDEKYIFLNETSRYSEGKFAAGPAFRSDVAREHPDPNTTEVESSEAASDCLAADDIALRYAAGLDTYRYWYAGNFTNISPVPWLGAFHWTDLLMIFGTYNEDVGQISQLEVETSQTMQDFMLAFLKDANTVNVSVGWPLYEPDAPQGGMIIEFGMQVPAKNITGEYVDGACSNSSLTFPLDG